MRGDFSHTNLEIQLFYTFAHLDLRGTLVIFYLAPPGPQPPGYRVRYPQHGFFSLWGWSFWAVKEDSNMPGGCSPLGGVYSESAYREDILNVSNSVQ